MFVWIVLHVLQGGYKSLYKNQAYELSVIIIIYNNKCNNNNWEIEFFFSMLSRGAFVTGGLFPGTMSETVARLIKNNSVGDMIQNINYFHKQGLSLFLLNWKRDQKRFLLYLIRQIK